MLGRPVWDRPSQEAVEPELARRAKSDAKQAQKLRDWPTPPRSQGIPARRPGTRGGAPLRVPGKPFRDSRKGGPGGVLEGQSRRGAASWQRGGFRSRVETTQTTPGREPRLGGGGPARLAICFASPARPPGPGPPRPQECSGRGWRGGAWGGRSARTRPFFSPDGLAEERAWAVGLAGASWRGEALGLHSSRRPTSRELGCSWHSPDALVFVPRLQAAPAVWS